MASILVQKGFRASAGARRKIAAKFVRLCGGGGKECARCLARVRCGAGRVSQRRISRRAPACCPKLYLLAHRIRFSFPPAVFARPCRRPRLPGIPCGSAPDACAARGFFPLRWATRPTARRPQPPDASTAAACRLENFPRVPWKRNSSIEIAARKLCEIWAREADGREIRATAK